MRERKTQLMQRVTRAYQDNDLLQLLSLQIEIEQIDAGHLGSLGDARLKHYNAVLRDQSRALDAELDDVIGPAAMAMQLTSRRPNANQFEHALHSRQAGLRRYCVEAQAELTALDDARLRYEMIRDLDLRRKAEQDDFDDELEFDIPFGPMTDFGVAVGPFGEVSQAPPKRRRKSKKRK